MSDYPTELRVVARLDNEVSLEVNGLPPLSLSTDAARDLAFKLMEMADVADGTRKP